MIHSLELIKADSSSSELATYTDYIDYDKEDVDTRGYFAEKGWIDATKVSWTIYAKTYLRNCFGPQKMSNKQLATLLQPIVQFHIEFGQVVLKQINNTSDCEQGMALFATLLENINYVVRLQHMLPLGKHAKPVLGRNADVFGWLAATVEYCQVAKQRKLAAQSPARLLMGVCKMIILSYENYETEFKFRSSHLAPLVIQILHQYCRPEEYIVSAIMIYELYSLLTGHLG
jgi:hypothetical protein